MYTYNAEGLLSRYVNGRGQQTEYAYDALGRLSMLTDKNGLYYMRARYYSPEIRRFINRDVLTGSIEDAASLNRYSYVEGNPVSYTDPFGLRISGKGRK